MENIKRYIPVFAAMPFASKRLERTLRPASRHHGHHNKTHRLLAHGI